MEKSQEEPKRPSALDLLRKQADTQPARESPEAVRARMTVELDQAMRGIDKNMAEVVGQARRARVSAWGSIGCIINLRADYNSFTVGVELINAGRFGRREARLGVAQLKTTADDLARYVLGADSDFEKVMAAAKPAGAPP